MSKSVALLLASLYAVIIEAVSPNAALSASTPRIIWILGNFNSEARL
jgi:hypothetical protein